MRACLLLLGGVVAACSGRDDRPVPAVVATAPEKPAISPPPAPAARARVVTAPPGAEITLVAVTDAGDSAVSADASGALRWWPTLDGTREPVVVRAPAAAGLALGRDGAAFVIAVVDDAGGLLLVRLDEAGRELGRASIAPDPGFDEVVGCPGGVLVHGRDEVLRRFDARGAFVASLAPPPGQRVLSLATRHGRAVAAVGDGSSREVTRVRWLDLDAGLTWGEALTLPEPLLAEVALSPSGHRLVGSSVATGALTVIELSSPPKVIASRRAVDSDLHAPPRTLGFTDDEHAILARGSVVLWDRAPQDPWAVTSSQLARGSAPAVVGDRIVVGAEHLSLVLATTDATQTLGYEDAGAGPVAVAGDAVTIAIDGDLLWLDRDLRERRRATGKGDIATNVALDATQVTTVDGGRVSIYDTATRKVHDVGAWPDVTRVEYDDRARVLKVISSDRIHRFAVDLDAGRETPLRDLSTPVTATVIHADPETAGGVAAIALVPADDGANRVDVFGEGTPGQTGAIKRTTRMDAPPLASLIGVDRQGRAYVLHDAALQVFAYPGSSETIALPFTATLAAVDGEGDRIVVANDKEVAALDHRGRVGWRRPAWQTLSVHLTADGRRVLVDTHGGLLALDAASGERTAAGCGWGFGLHASASTASFSAPTVCAEPE